MESKVWVWVERLARWSLGLVFLYASIFKILDPAGFAQDIAHYAILPDFLVNGLAIVLPWIEAIMGLALIAGFAADGAVLLLNIMLLVFLFAMGQALARGLDINCGCFGHSNAREDILLPISRDIGMLVLAGWIFLYRKKRALAIP